MVQMEREYLELDTTIIRDTNWRDCYGPLRHNNDHEAWCRV